MALNDEEKSGQQIRVVYKMNYSLDPMAASLSVIPVNDFCQNGYYSDWDEVKQQLIGLCFKERSKAPHNLHFQAIIRPLNYDLDVASREDYFTALKLAEMSGHPLDIMIKNPVVSTSGDKPNDFGAKASTSKTDDHKQKMERQSSVASNDSPNKTNTYSTQTEDKVVVMNEKQIEKIKKEITIDVTKRLISKLNECLSELTTSDSGSQGQDLISDYLTGKGAEGGQPIPKVVHKGIICDNCDQQIEGIRYKCINCLDYDLCEPCKQKPVHYPNHAFNKIERYIPGIPKQTLPPSLDFLKPFLSGATIDPNTKDVVLTLDVDLTNGTICKSNVSQPSSANGSPKEANDDNVKPDEQQNGSSGKKSASDDESSQLLGPQVPQKRYCSEKRAKQITKKLEKLKHKSQLYTNLLQTSDDRSALSTHEKPKPMPIICNPSLVSNKTLYLSGLLIGDETIPEGTRMPPNTKFRKTWKVRNTGTKVWSGRTTLRFVWGHPELEPFGKVTEVQAPTLRPGEEGKVTIRFTSPNPSTVTRYQSYWRLHHRGQPFGPRLVVKIIVDPLATCITPSPTPLAPILSKDSRSAAIPMPAPKIPTRPPNQHLLTVLDTNCNLEAVANIQQSIIENQRNLADRLLGKQTAAAATKEKTQKTSVKKLTEALSQVKELRFDLDDNETIPMKSNVKSHTTTPANTPFDISPPKSPEPTTSTNTFDQIEATEKIEKNEDKSEITDEKIAEHKADGNESDGESLDVLSLSSGGESSDEFVLVPFPTCFDLNVPFTVKDVNSNSNSDEDSPQNKSELNCFEIVDNETNNETNEPSESEEDNTVQKEEVSAEQIRADHRLAAATLAAMAAHQQMQELFGQEMSRAEKHMETALDLTKVKPQTVDNVSATQPQEAEAQTPAEDQASSESEPQVKPKTSSPSTNPFRNNPNETENVIHVLPESIVTGALSAAAHVYNNVSRALFSRNEGNNFAWVTSPPPAALPLPNMYWDNQGNPQYPTQPPYDGPPHFARPPPPSDAPTAPLMTPNLAAQNPPPPPPAPSRLSSALSQLYEMGFWNQRLNQELLEKNDFDVNDTIEDLLSPDKNRHTRRGQSPPEPSEPVVSHQPTNRNGFIDEFD